MLGVTNGASSTNSRNTPETVVKLVQQGAAVVLELKVRVLPDVVVGEVEVVAHGRVVAVPARQKRLHVDGAIERGLAGNAEAHARLSPAHAAQAHNTQLPLDGFVVAALHGKNHVCVCFVFVLIKKIVNYITVPKMVT
jgi:hypothetical protein